MTQEALRMALEALYPISHNTTDDPRGQADKAITAIKEALAQTEPWEKFCDSNCVWTDHHPDCKLAQRTWVGLTNEELTDLFYNTNLGQQSAVSQAIALLKEKNT
jgi:hypothetical protein